MLIEPIYKLSPEKSSFTHMNYYQPESEGKFTSILAALWFAIIYQTDFSKLHRCSLPQYCLAFVLKISD